MNSDLAMLDLPHFRHLEDALADAKRKARDGRPRYVFHMSGHGMWHVEEVEPKAIHPSRVTVVRE